MNYFHFISYFTVDTSHSQVQFSWLKQMIFRHFSEFSLDLHEAGKSQNET